ncbi:MAG: phosphotransferase family protein [Sphingomonadales bacterium]|nr:MAG: phosphotransferase family protein [Sphingomonadales bacterium]
MVAAIPAGVPDEAAPVDIERLAAWMDREGIGQGAISEVTALAGGTQNIILRFIRDGQSYVLRRPPLAMREGNNETMRREARVLAALAGSKVPHPALIASCSEPDILGASFYLMEAVEGFNATQGLPKLHASDPAIRHRMGIALVESAAAIGEIDHVAAGLGDFGKPDNFLGRQVGRWKAQLESYHEFESWPGPAGLPGADVAARYLDEAQPASFTPGLMHGDFTLNNVMYRPDSGEIAAVIDWELSTIGDPLVDLGWLLATWPGIPPVDLNVLRVTPWEGFPVAGELVERYSELSGRSLANMDWYFVLACYKLAIILEGTFARACGGKASHEVGWTLHETSTRLLQRAVHRVG